MFTVSKDRERADAGFMQPYAAETPRPERAVPVYRIARAGAI